MKTIWLASLSVLIAMLISQIAVAQGRDTLNSDPHASIGLRDHVGLGLSFGAPTAACVDARVFQWHDGRIEVEGSYGAGIAAWGIGESHSAAARLDLHLSDDGTNDALLISPRVGYSEIVGEPAHKTGWFSLKFSPYETVGAPFVCAGLVWVHEYATRSFELSAVPGIAYAVSGRDNNNIAASRQLSAQGFVKAAIRF
jgi:hypothetical protein